MARGWWLAWAGLIVWLVPCVTWGQERVYDWSWGMHPMWGVRGLGMALTMLVFWRVIAGIVLDIRWSHDLK